jgi:hypothetical protein
MIRQRVTDKAEEVLSRTVRRILLACSGARETGGAILGILRETHPAQIM